MEFRFSPQEEAFRQEVVEFLKDELPPGFVGYETGDEYTGEAWELTKSFSKKLAAKGWLTLSWPREYGGQARSYIEQLVYTEEMAYHGAPAAAMDMGVGGVSWVGPTLMLYGTEGQKKEHLPPIAAGERFWCTGYSEPGSGSDLASLQTCAVSDGDDYIVNGQKIWTSGGHVMDWYWLAVRTDTDAPKHKGISILMVDMRSAGITIRPILNMAGGHGFNEIFLEDVRVPKRNRVGEENQGWYILAVSLDFERSIINFVASAKRLLDRLIEYVKDTRWNGEVLSRKALIRHKMAEMATDVELGRWLMYRVAWMLSRGKVANYEASISKLYSTELRQRIFNASMQIAGLLGQLEGGSRWTPFQGSLERGYLLSVADTIESGTSEVQRNIIATRGLGLPKQ
ncbi:MAG: acyl-CoA dehydrogenase family protein [Dehalococcoidia bacterium]